VVVQCKGLTKKYRDIAAVDGLDLSVEAGSVFGFLGRNGAGKTTTLRMLLGLARPTSGTAMVLGETLGASPATRARVGYLPDTPAFYPWMSGKEFLLFSGRLAGVPEADLGSQADELLELVDLKDVRQRTGGYSRGMKQRLGMAQALVGQPEIVFMDEPTSALDPIGRRDVLELIARISDRTTVVFSTHILADVERVCDQVGIIEKGKLVTQSAVDDLKGVGGEVFVVRLVIDNTSDIERLITDLKALDLVRELSHTGDTLELRVNSAKDARIELPRMIAASGIPLTLFEERSSTLEDVFIRLVQG